jgi:hypothetical protein
LFREGEEYSFIIHKLVELQDNNKYLIVCDTEGIKHFIPAAAYNNYTFSAGNFITCKVVKINCTGRIILEPRHPVYQEGKVYEFEIVATRKPGIKGVITVADVFGNQLKVNAPAQLSVKQFQEKKIPCLVKKIRNGVPEIEYCQ